MELMAACADLAVPAEVMQHVARVESSFNPYAIGVVGGRLARQPRNLGEAVATAEMLEREGYNFSLGIAQVNRHNLARQGLSSFEDAFAVCPNATAGSRILAECYERAGRDWSRAFSCYYSGDFTTGFDHGYVQKVVASWRGAVEQRRAVAIPVARAAGGVSRRSAVSRTEAVARSLPQRRSEGMGRSPDGSEAAAPAGRQVQERQDLFDQALSEPGLPVAVAAASDAAPVVVQLMDADAQAQPAPISAVPDGPAPIPPEPPPEQDAAFVF
ncbi:lytic transglycosylase domain-containing protein [Coralloluteibacterium stylophorae]|uniref:lytic transglycosylase domain-containing protein n=1 Tax=Coralloluteibacterium stylophorae TaxID=1776034 RepID=UPI00360904F3